MDLRHLIGKGENLLPLWFAPCFLRARGATPQFRKEKVGKSVYWFRKGGGDPFFGNVEDVPDAEARRLFRQHILSLAEAASDGKRGP
jgi:hypothetical protein